MESLPLDVLDRIPLDNLAQGALACTSTSFRDAIAALRCRRGVCIFERHARCFQSPRYQALETLLVKGPTQPLSTAPSPPPLAQVFPRLASLTLVYCRPFPSTFWDALFANAPALKSLVVRPVLYGMNYAATINSLMRLLRSEGAHRLDTLEIMGDGLVVWSRSFGVPPDTPMEQAYASNAAMKASPMIHFSGLRVLTITGRQFYPSLDAPLEKATLQEPWEDALLLDRMGPTARNTLKSLRYELSIDRLGAVRHLQTFTVLKHLDIAFVSLHIPRHFDAALQSLALLPPCLEDLHVNLGFMRFLGEDVVLDYDTSPLRHLARLRHLHFTVSYATPNCAPLFVNLLGTRAPTLDRVTLKATHGAADRLKEMRDRLCEDEFFEYEYNADLDRLHDRIKEVEDASRVPRADMETALERFPHATFCVRGFECEVPPDCRARLL